MTRPLPDWHHPLRTAAGTAWAAHDEPGVAFVAPAALAAGADGFHLDLVGQDLAVAGAGGHARTVAFWRQRLDAVPDEPVRTQLVRGGYRTVLPLPVVSGTLRLRPAEALGTAPLDVLLDPRGVDGLHVGTQLDAVAADLLLAALRRGAALLTAQALLRVDGVAARHPARLTVDVATLRTGTASLAGDGTGVDEPTLRATLRDDPGRLGVTVTPPPVDDETALTCADAVADRLLARLLVPRLADDGTVRLHVTDAPGVDRLEEDLAATVVVPHAFAPATYPWGPLAHATAADVERAVHRHTAPAFDSGRRTLAVTTVVQPPWSGVAALAVDLVVPAAPPERPRTLRETVLLEGADLATVGLTLAPGEPLTGSAQVLVVFDGTGAQAVGPQVPLVDDVLVLTADAVPATLLPVRLDAALARLAAHVDVTWTGVTDGTPTRQQVRLAAGSQRATLLVPADATDDTLAATAHHADGRTAATDPQPAGPLALDPFAFPGTGLQEVALSATFAPGAPALVVELLADAPDDAGAETRADTHDEPTAPDRVVLTPDRPTATWSWFSGSPFHAFRWRRAGVDQPWHPGTAGALDLTTTPVGSPR